jgi:PhnB protein
MAGQTLNPYINFKDNAREAMTFYQSVLGGELTMNTFAEFGASSGPADENLIMHSQLETPAGFTLMASDTPAHEEFKGAGNISISLSGDDEAALSGYWNRLKEGGTIQQPLEKAPWGDRFGMLADKFGVNWLVNITGAK